MFFYDTSRVAGQAGPQINVWKMNGTRAYLTHFDNLLFLQFVSSNPRSSEAEKRQALVEMDVCERKLKFWQRHPKYEHEEALRGVDKLRKNWRMTQG